MEQDPKMQALLEEYRRKSGNQPKLSPEQERLLGGGNGGQPQDARRPDIKNQLREGLGSMNPTEESSMRSVIGLMEGGKGKNQAGPSVPPAGQQPAQPQGMQPPRGEIPPMPAPKKAKKPQDDEDEYKVIEPIPMG